ncbi:hypothetical protein CY34DRAFT_107951 [Suillus luteus UH-Slu-Lm8-n1]|uniref:Uncharacterized protein n=1 Tax=Suillus luteus UH-Slu-Lm8-n1 TaxID=930992 RepID=A0A0D0APX3_9AGAM|nr:hypothetical protein CY34DRAFT_107951 [Suillus luteus UH-Slu-Lm8-n1]
MDESLTNLKTLITYYSLQEMVAVNPHTNKKHTICRVPVMEGGQLKGYVTLSKRYQEIWPQLCYSIILLINVWKLWLKEEEKVLKLKEKKMATACQAACGGGADPVSSENKAFCGHNYWETLIGFFHYVLITEPEYYNINQFLGDLHSLYIITLENPNWEDIEASARDLWLGILIWREFVEHMSTHMDLPKEKMETLEKRGPFQYLGGTLDIQGMLALGGDEL